MAKTHNGQPQPIQPMVQSAMFYPNTYINFTQAGEYTKHYYNGTERICSRLGEQQVPVSVENEQELEAYKQDVKQIIYNAIGQHLYDEPTNMQEGDVIPLEFLQPCGNSNAIYYYHPNHLSSSMYVTDAQQSVVQSFLYAPYGEIISEYNTHAMGEAFPKYSFNAKELDEETGMYYYEARYYAPPTFTSRDPLFEKYFWMSPYAYCANNPVKYVDPSGRKPRLYTERKGLGHVFVTIRNGKNTIVYTYGRYLGGGKGKSSANSLDPSGRGVLIRLTGKEAHRYIQYQLKNNKAKVYEFKDASDDKVQDHFDKIFYSGRNLTPAEAKLYNSKINKFGTSFNARVIDTYNLFNNNCVSKSIDGIKAGGTKENFLENTGLLAPDIPNMQYQPISPIDIDNYLHSRTYLKNSNVKDVTEQLNLEYK